MPNPYSTLFWSDTQKFGVNSAEERFRALGAIMGEDDELVILRHPIDALGREYQAAHTAASNLGLHIQILDERDVMALKLSKIAANGGDFIRCYDRAPDGTETPTGGAGNNGVWADGSLRELKDNMKDLTEQQIDKILNNLKVYRFNFKNDSEKIIFVGPEAAEFRELTSWGDGRTLAPGTIAGIALRCVQYVWQFVSGLDKRLKAIENRLALTEDADGNPDV